MADNQALTITVGADFRALEAQLTRASRLLDTTMLTMVSRTSAAEKAIASRLGQGNIGKSLDNIFDRSRLAVIEEAGTKIPVFGSALVGLGPAGLAAAAGVGAAVAAMSELTKAADWAEDLTRAAKAIGLSTTQLQEFDFVAAATGIPVDKMRSSLQGLSETIGLVQDNLTRGKQGRQVKVFEAIFGENAEETKKHLRELGTNLDAILPKVLDFAAKLGPTQRAGLSQALRIDPQVLDSLVDARSKISGLIADVHRFGGVASEDMIAKAAKAAEEMHKLGAVIDLELKVAFAELAPVAEAAAQKLIAIAVAIGDIVRGAKDAVGAVGAMIAQLGRIPNIPHLPSGTGAVAGSAAQAVLDAFIPGLGVLRALANQGAADRTGKQQGSGRAPVNANAATPAIDFHTDTGGRHRAAADNNASEIFAVERAYIEALIKGAEDLDKLHALRLQLLAVERDSALSDIAAKKGITAATRKKAIDTANLTFDADVAAENASYQKQLTDHARDFQDRMTRLRDAQLTSEAAITGTLADRQALEREKLSDEQAQARRDLTDKLAEDKGYKSPAGQAQAAQLEAQLAASQAAQRDELARAQAEALAKQKLDLETIGLDTEKALLEQRLGLADTSAQRRRIELQILDLEEQLERAQLQQVIDAKGINSTDGQIAEAKLKELDALHAGRVAGIDRSTEGPFGQFIREGQPGVQDEARVQDFANALQQMNAGLADAIVNARNLGDVARSVFRQLAADLIKSALQEGEASLFGAAGKALGGTFLGSLFGLGGAGGGGSKPASLAIPGFASGTNYAPGGLAVVGERGRELVQLPGGSKVFSNGVLGGLRGVTAGIGRPALSQAFHFDLTGAVVTSDLIEEMNRIGRNAQAGAIMRALEITRSNLSAASRQDNLLRD